MANPVIISCPKGQFQKVATAVKIGMIWFNVWPDGSSISGVQYRQTYRETGSPAPTERYESVKVLEKGMAINSNTDIDVYIWCDNGDGSVRADLGG